MPQRLFKRSSERSSDNLRARQPFPNRQSSLDNLHAHASPIPSRSPTPPASVLLRKAQSQANFSSTSLGGDASDSASSMSRSEGVKPAPLKATKSTPRRPSTSDSPTLPPLPQIPEASSPPSARRFTDPLTAASQLASRLTEKTQATRDPAEHLRLLQQTDLLVNALTAAAEARIAKEKAEEGARRGAEQARRAKRQYEKALECVEEMRRLLERERRA